MSFSTLHVDITKLQGCVQRKYPHVFFIINPVFCIRDNSVWFCQIFGLKQQKPMYKSCIYKQLHDRLQLTHYIRTPEIYLYLYSTSSLLICSTINQIVQIVQYNKSNNSNKDNVHTMTPLALLRSIPIHSTLLHFYSVSFQFC